MLADQAEQQRDAICAAERSAKAALARMSTAADARAYMQLALLATNARDAKDRLDAALLQTAQIPAQTAGAAASLASADQSLTHATDVKNAAKLRTMVEARTKANAAFPPAARDDQVVNFRDAVNFALPDDGPYCAATLASARATTDHARDALTHANAVLATPAADAATNAVAAIDIALQLAGQMNDAIRALPGAPAACSNAGTYAAQVAALNTANGNLGAASALLTASNGQLAVHANRANDALTAQQTVVGDEGRRLGVNLNKVIYAAPVVPASNNQLRRQIDDAKALTVSSLAVAANVVDAADAAQHELAQLDAPAQAVGAHIPALRNCLQQIETAAQNASLTIPYDPGANSASAKLALDQEEAADAGVAALLQLQRQAVDALTAPGGPSREAIQEKIIKRVMAVNHAVARAEKSRGFWGSLVASCLWEEEPIRNARQRLEDARQQEAARTRTLAELQVQQQRVDSALQAAQQCAAAARAAAQQAADLRIEQLRAEGHGPQRHEGNPTLRDLGERALYRIDPETHTQRDAEDSTQLHSASETASKFKSNAIFVKAEALAREQSALLQAMGPQPDFSARVPLSAIGNDVAVGVSCKADARPARSETSLGPTETVPVRAGYVYGAATPPPTREQMDKGRMADAIRDNTEPTVYGPAASAFAVLRPDINGKLYLRTMWPEN